MPASSGRLLDLLGAPAGPWRSFQSIPFERADLITVSDANLIPPGTPIGGAPYPIFPKLEVDKIAPSGDKPKEKEKAKGTTSSAGQEAEQVDWAVKYASLTGDLPEIGRQILVVGDGIREMKKSKKREGKEEGGGGGASDKAALKRAVSELTFLKELYKASNNGIAFEPKINS